MNKEQELRLHGPFKTDDFASYIYGSNDKIGGDNPVLEIRGWGYLTGNGHGALGLSHAEAVAEQKRFASFVVDALNAASPPTVAAGGVTEAIAAVERERRRHFCSGDDCEPYDHGRDEGFDLALKALRSLPAALDEGIREGWPEHASPLPWKYVASASPSSASAIDWIEDATGGIVVEHVGHIDGPAICAAVNGPPPPSRGEGV